MRKTLKKFSVILGGLLIAMSMTACSEEKKQESTSIATDGDTVVEMANQVADEDVPQLEGYTLLWHDEFNGDTLNEEIWNIFRDCFIDCYYWYYWCFFLVQY